jgi:hypothetical protein
MGSDKKFKFQHYLNKVEGRRFLWMSRDEWEAAKPLFGKPVKIDISKTPMANVAKDASILATVAVHSSVGNARIDIYRYDKQDQPTPVNKDSYIVMENIIDRPDYHQLVIKSSTSDSPELRGFLKSNVGLVKTGYSDDHWFTELPSSVLCVIEKSS